MTSPVQRRLANGQERTIGVSMLVIGVLLAAVSAVRLVADPSAVWSWIVGCLAMLQIAAGIHAVRKHRRGLAELEREHSVGAGSDAEIRRRHGL